MPPSKKLTMRNAVPAHLLAAAYSRKAANKAEAEARKKAEHREALEMSRLDKRKANALTAETRLLVQIERMERHPSQLAVRKMRGIANNNDLPASARVAAAGVLLRWAQNANPKAPKKRRNAK